MAPSQMWANQVCVLLFTAASYCWPALCWASLALHAKVARVHTHQGTQSTADCTLLNVVHHGRSRQPAKGMRARAAPGLCTQHASPPSGLCGMQAGGKGALTHTAVRLSVRRPGTLLHRWTAGARGNPTAGWRDVLRELGQLPCSFIFASQPGAAGCPPRPPSTLHSLTAFVARAEGQVQCETAHVRFRVKCADQPF